MTSQYQTFDYFSKNLIDPQFKVFDVLDNNNHPEHERLMFDLNNIDKTDLEKYVIESNVDFYLDRVENKDIGRRAHYLVDKLHKDIARVRIEKLLDKNARPAPYDSNNLSELYIDKNFLASIDQFKTDNYGFEKGNLVYTLCPILEQSNSSYWIFIAILKFAKENKINFKIRLAPFIEIPLNDYQPMFYRMLVYGKPLDWQKILSLRNDDFGRWFDEKEYNRNGFTDYVWSPKDNEVHFTCEELPKFDFKGIKSSRYFHAIFNKATAGIKHCDGAIRIYSDYELNNRVNFHVRDTEARKIGKRIKIFQYENKDNMDKEIDQDTFCQLVINFFVWNDDIQSYFK